MIEDVSSTVGGVRVLWCAADGPVVDGDRAAADLVGAAFGRADVVAVPVARLAPGFFDLRTGIAGEVVQKFATYRFRLAVVGDVSRHVAASSAFRDLVREANRGSQTWFVADADELTARLTPGDEPGTGRSGS
jgi:Domain of unknown function (DUF4180)